MTAREEEKENEEEDNNDDDEVEADVVHYGYTLGTLLVHSRYTLA